MKHCSRNLFAAMLLLAGPALAACDLTVQAGEAEDASIPDAQVQQSDGGPEAGATSDAGGPSCKGYAATCAGNSYCCSGRCDGFSGFTPGSCACIAAGYSCASDPACCSGHCVSSRCQ